VYACMCVSMCMCMCVHVYVCVCICVCVPLVDQSGSESNLYEKVSCRQRSDFESHSSGVKESDNEVTNLFVRGGGGGKKPPFLT